MSQATNEEPRLPIVLSEAERHQLTQTVEVFEQIVPMQPHDYEAAMILRGAYTALGDQRKVLEVSRIIIRAYMLCGMNSKALLECEDILNVLPDDSETLGSMAEIKSRARATQKP